MIFGNLTRIVSDHYVSLGQETGLSSPYSYLFLLFIFWLLPLGFGFLLAKYVTLWIGFITASATVLSVLTGFAVNTIVLLMRYDKDGSHPYEQNTVRKTKEFTLYTLLLGVVLLMSMVVGVLISQIDGATISEIVFITSGLIYTMLIHYFLTLLVITHRFRGLIHADVL